MAEGREFIIRNITIKADELARQWEKTRDPGIRDQWYQLVKTVSHYPEPREDSPPKRGRKKILGKSATR